MTLAFAASYVCLCAAQGATVATPRLDALASLRRLRSRWWALIPLASVIVVVLAIRAAAGVADGLTYLALFTTPPLAALALAWLFRRRLAALAVAPLFALSWAARGSLAGEAAAVALTALGCGTLGALLTSVTPVLWVKLGIIAMSIVDTALVVAQLLQAPNDNLNAAAPALGLPQFQRAEFGDALMGYGDLFIAALLGAVLLREARPRGRAALLTAVLGITFGALFLWIDQLPATVPVALALTITELRAARRRAGGRGTTASRESLPQGSTAAHA